MDMTNACEFYPKCQYVASPDEEGAVALKEHLRIMHNITR